MGVREKDYPAFLSALRVAANFHGALVTMPHKVTTCALVDQVSNRAKVSGAYNAILKLPDGQLLGDQFDGAGFVADLQRKGQSIAGKRALLIGCGGVGSAIAASLAEAVIAGLNLYDLQPQSAVSLQKRMQPNFPLLQSNLSANDPEGCAMLLEMIPLYLAFFGFGQASVNELRVLYE